MSAGTWSSTRLRALLPVALALTLSSCLKSAGVRPAGKAVAPGKVLVFGRVALVENGAPAEFTFWREGSLDLYRVETGGEGPTLRLDKDGWFFWEADPGTLVVSRLQYAYGIRPCAFFSVPDPGAPAYLGTLKLEVAAHRVLGSWQADKVEAGVLDERESAEKELKKRFPGAEPPRTALMRQDPELPPQAGEGYRRRLAAYLNSLGLLLRAAP